MTTQFGASLAVDASSVNYDHNMFIIQATAYCDSDQCHSNDDDAHHIATGQKIKCIVPPKVPLSMSKQMITMVTVLSET